MATRGRCVPEEVDNALEVSRDEHHQGDDCGEDESRQRGQPPNVRHRQDIWLKTAAVTARQPISNPRVRHEERGHKSLQNDENTNARLIQGHRSSTAGISNSNRGWPLGLPMCFCT